MAIVLPNHGATGWDTTLNAALTALDSNVTQETQDRTNADSAHVAATDPHGDRAWANTQFVAQSNVGVAGGVASLNDQGVLQAAQAPVASVDGITGSVDLSARYVPQSYLSTLKPTLIYSGGSYPPRPSWATVVTWQGSVDPGAAAFDNDEWIQM